MNLLQCRPFQTIGLGGRSPRPRAVDDGETVLRMEGGFMGGNIALPIAQVILVDPEPYCRLGLSEKYTVARLIGQLNRSVVDQDKNPTLLLGPGRWGTGTPAMGVPVHFAEINHISALAEISYRDGSLIPDLSFGSHFFHDLIETRIFYLAIYPSSRGCCSTASGSSTGPTAWPRSARSTRPGIGGAGGGHPRRRAGPPRRCHHPAGGGGADRGRTRPGRSQPAEPRHRGAGQGPVPGGGVRQTSCQPTAGSPALRHRTGARPRPSTLAQTTP